MRLHVIDTAPGDTSRPVVVCLHGIPERAAAWSGVIERLAADARVVVPDLPGFGDSDKPRDLDYSLPSLSRVVGDVIGQRLGHARVHLAIHDIGGPIGLLWALREPQRFASLLVLNTALLDRHFRPPPPALIAQVPRLGPRIVATALRNERGVRRALARSTRAPVDPLVTDAIVEQFRDPAARHASGAVWGSYRRTLPEIRGLRQRLGALDVPTRIVFGDADPYCRPGCADTIARAIPGATVRMLEGVGHFVPAEAPSETAGELRAQLAAAAPVRA